MRITGTINDGTHYEVGVEAGRHISGSVKVRRLVDLWSGSKVPAGPTGPMVVVDPSVPATVLALLVAQTTVTGVEDGADSLAGPPRVPGRVL